MTARLPIPGQDNGAWGDILNEYLVVAHKLDGNLKDGVVSSATLQDNSVMSNNLNAGSGSNGQVLTKNTAAAGGLIWGTSVSGATNLSASVDSTQLTVASDTGTDAVVGSATTVNAGVMSAADKAKLTGIAPSATANSSDAALLSRANHTGTQAASTVTGLATVATSGVYNDLTGKPTIPSTPGEVGAQPVDAELTALASLASAANKGIQFSGSGTAATYDLTTFAKTILDDANQAAVQATLGLIPGTDVQTYSAKLSSYAALTWAADQIIYQTSSSAVATTTLSAFMRTLLDDADAATARTTLGALTTNQTGALIMSSGKYNGAGGARAVNTSTVNRLYLDPFVLDRAVTLSSIAAEVTTGGTTGSVIRLVLTTSNANYLPGNLLLDTGTIDATTTGFKEAAISLTIGPGMYWRGCVAQVATPTMRCTGAAAPVAVPVSAPQGTSGFPALYQDGVSGAVPNTLTASAGVSSSAFVWLKEA